MRLLKEKMSLVETTNGLELKKVFGICIIELFGLNKMEKYQTISIVVFKDDNADNTSIESLELITMTENMYRNSIHNYPKEIIPSLLKKTIRN